MDEKGVSLTTTYFRSHNMNPLDLFNQVKEMIEKKIRRCKKFVDDNKGATSVTTLNKPKELVSGNEMVSGALDEIKRLVLIRR